MVAAAAGHDLVSAVASKFAELHTRGELAELRPGQLRMATLIADAISTRQHLVVDAGTGVGKTLAYLIPIVLSGRRTVISTATKSLQEQLASRDLPMIRNALGIDVTWTVIKGRNSYLCKQRLTEVTEAATLPASIRRLIEWSRTTETGDRDEIEADVPDSVWRRLSVSGDQCPGRDACPQGIDCFAERARTRALGTDLVVTNHHVYAASLSSQQMLPEHDVAVFDEAHKLDEAIRQVTSTRVDPVRVARMIGRSEADALTVLREVLGPHAGRYLRSAPAGLDATLDSVRLLVSKVAAEQRALAASGNQRARRRAHSLALIAENMALSTSSGERLRWVEGTAQQPILRSFAAGSGAHQALGDSAQRTAVLTSATIGSDPLNDLGLLANSAEVERVPSPFAYETQAMFYCAAHLPDPRSKEWPTSMHAELNALIKAAGGRTLALFTSWTALHAALKELSPQITGTVLIQGESGRRELLQRFRDDVTSCLFATIGLAQGTDVPGDALTLVTIDRLPFPPVGDPYFEARRAAAGGDSFAKVDLCHAQTVLAQVAGRLIRTQTDRGVFAVLDPRLASAPYRWPLVNSVPAMRRTRDFNEVCDFLQGDPAS
jgi:ATP-dependent DNA helicase DinG